MKSESEVKTESEFIEPTTESTGPSSDISKSSSGVAFGYVKGFFHKWIAVIAFIVLWQILPSLNPIWAIFIPTPTVIIATIYDLIVNGQLINDILISLFRVITAFAIAVAVGLVVGFLLGGFFRSLQKTLDPLLQMISQANPFTLFPVFIAFLGIGEVSKIAFIYFVSQWPVMFNTTSGISNVDPVLVKVAKTAGLGKFQTFSKVLLPASIPTIFTGIKMAATFSLFMLIGAEMLGSTAGLGYLVMQSEGVMNYPNMFAAIVVVALIGIAFMYCITLVERHLTKNWRQEVSF